VTCIIDLIQISQGTTHFHGPRQSLHLAGFKSCKVVVAMQLFTPSSQDIKASIWDL